MTTYLRRLRDNEGLGQVTRYVAVGLVSFAVDLGVLLLCWHLLGAPLWLATSAGFWTSFGVNFALSRAWTFGLRHPLRGAELVRYSVLVGANYVLTIAAVEGLHLIGWAVPVARIATLAVLTVSTFVLYRKWVFVAEDEPMGDLSDPLACCVCGSTMRSRESSWCRWCATCGTWGSTLVVGINEEGTHRGLDEKRREEGLAELRHDNLAVVADRLLGLGLRSGARVLDVGSAHGWFLRAARERGLDAEGIEPDVAIAHTPDAQASGRVRIGFFPDVLDADERFDAITFNDVLEHLPDPDAAVAACRLHLKPGGLLSINIPSSGGLFYRVALRCNRMGLRSAFERLWQVGLPSPHLWYFAPSGLTELGRRHGFELAQRSTLDSVRRRGLWQRAHADRRPTPISALGVAGLWVLAPILNRPAASDIIHLVFRAAETPATG